jgi:HK97 family phage major capsid protein
MDRLMAGPTAAKRSLLASEARKFEKLAKEIAKIDRWSKPGQSRQDDAQRAAAALDYSGHSGFSGGARTSAGPSPYRPDVIGTDGRQVSFLKDLVMEQTGWIEQDGRDRLAEQGKRQGRLEAAAHAAEVSGFAGFMDRVNEYEERAAGDPEFRVNPNTTLGTGGEFVPPKWLIDSYIPLARPKRVAADRCMNLPLPPSTDVINIPKITVGSLTAIQPAQGQAVASQDIVTSTVAGAVNTISGQEDISMQLLEQSPIAMDGVIFQDLQADLERRLDIQVLYGTATNGQLQGMLTLSGINSVTFTSGSPTVPLFYGYVPQAISQINSNRYDAPTAMVVHSRRWNWMLAALDGNSNRPLVLPNSQGNFQSSGRVDQVSDMNSSVGSVVTLPTFVDPNVPTTMNGTATTGGTQDVAIVAKFDDSWLFESYTRFRPLPEILSGTLQVRFQVYRYVTICHRFPPSISAITGTGLAAPSGF